MGKEVKRCFLNDLRLQVCLCACSVLCVDAFVSRSTYEPAFILYINFSVQCVSFLRTCA